MGALVRMLAPLLVLVCAGCIHMPWFGGGSDDPPAPDHAGSPGKDRGSPFVCESRNKRTQLCPADTRGGVRLLRQLSGADCVEGSSWGYDHDGVWVSRGCRAAFVTGRGGGDGHRPPPGPGSGRVVRCESRDGRHQRCRVEVSRGVVLSRQLSRAPCIRDSSWGWDRNGIWVGSGCRAEFSVR